MATDAEVSVVAAAGEWRVIVRGAVDGNEPLRRLEEALDEAVAWWGGDVVLDLTNATDLSPEAVEAVLDARRALTGLERRLVVTPDLPSTAGA